MESPPEEVKDQAFCYFGLLKNRDLLLKLLTLLPQARQSVIQSLIEQVAGLSEEELQRHLKQLRDSEVETISKQVRQKFGDHWENVTPGIQKWVCGLVRESHGQEDY